MKIWNKAPLVRLLFPFAAGIITAIYFPFVSESIPLIVAFAAVIISGIVLIPKWNITFKMSWWYGLLINTFLFFGAFQLTVIRSERFDPAHFSNFTDSSSVIRARILQPCIEKEKSLKTVAEIILVNNKEKVVTASGKAMIYFKKDKRTLQLNYGDEVILKTIFKKIAGPQNPGEFDYQKFLAHHSIYDQAYVNSNNWIFTGENSGNPILKYSIMLRDRLLSVLSCNHVTGDEYGVGAALMLGYTDQLDPGIISAYSSTGALHVLSVSGLHVAIVYIVFNALLFFLDRFKHGKIIKAIILILLLWFYSALTGLSPSVLRAATMFSFIIIAKTFNRHTNIYNTLAASAFVLLIINPFLVLDVGFQLSYIAVVGIVYIQPKIHQWFEPEGWLPEQIWSVTAVSIAAQIATFPLGLFYFHQFPNYFLIANFIVIPVSSVIIYLGIALFAFAKIPFIAGWLGIGFSWSVWFLNASVKQIEHWPFALLQGISISFFEMLLIYAIVLLLIFYFEKRKFFYLKAALGISIVLIASQLIEQQQQEEQKKFIVYNIPKISAMDFIRATDNVLFTDSAFIQNESGLNFHVKHNWWDLGLETPQMTAGHFENNFLHINDQMIVFNELKMVRFRAGDIIPINKADRKITLDYLIISGDPNMKIENLLSYYQPKQVVFDSSNSEYRIRKWETECKRLRQNFYSVIDSGAFVVDL